MCKHKHTLQEIVYKITLFVQIKKEIKIMYKLTLYISRNSAQINIICNQMYKCITKSSAQFDIIYKYIKHITKSSADLSFRLQLELSIKL